MTDLSVVLSTKNRAPDLERLLESLLHSRLKTGRAYEIVVVDNASTDETSASVRRFQSRPNAPIRYIFEPRLGKSRGLNTGLASARGRIIAFTDDDTIVPADWVDSIIEYFDEHPSAACIGGMVRLFNPADAPTSIRLETVPKVVQISDFSPTYIPLIGCNMAMRAEVLRRVGPFDVDIGPGTRLQAAEDLDYLYRVIRDGYPIHYVPHIMLFHNHGRREAAQLAGLQRNYIRGRGAFYCKYLLKRDRQVARWAYWECSRYVGVRIFRAIFSAREREELKSLLLLARGGLAYALRSGRSGCTM